MGVEYRSMFTYAVASVGCIGKKKERGILFSSDFAVCLCAWNQPKLLADMYNLPDWFNSQVKLNEAVGGTVFSGMHAC